METISEFLNRNGIPESEVTLDGTFKEIKTLNFKGWYVGNDLGGGKRSITIQDWRTNARKSFIEGVDLSDPKERAKLEEIRVKYEKEKLDLQILKKEFSQDDLKKFRQESWGTPSQYLLNKKIIGDFGTILIESKAEVTDLIIPMLDKNFEVWNYQKIQDSGFKAFVPGGLVQGLSFELVGFDEAADNSVLICEGFATACSVKMAMPLSTVVCAFSANNLTAVAEIYRTRLPNSRIVVCGDDDWKRLENSGYIKAKAAAESVLGEFLIPVFKDIRGQEWTDFNDLHQHYGLAVVTEQIKKVLMETALPTDNWNEAFQAAKIAEESPTKASSKARDENLKKADSVNAINPYINGVQPLAMRTSKNGQIILPTEFVVAKALFDYYEDRTVVSEESIFVFDKTHWKEVDNFNKGKIQIQIQVMMAGLATNSKLNAIYEQFVRLLPKSPRNLFEPRPSVINFQNGTVHVEQILGKWTLRFAKHSKLDFCTHMIPIDFDETRSVKNEPFEKMLARVFVKSLDKEAMIRSVRQMYGACVAPMFPHLFMLYGNGGSGKSSLIIPAQRLVHNDNWSSVEPHEFEGFLMESMAGKLVNIVLDIDTQQPIKDNHIKKIEDRVPVRIDRKFKTAIKAPLPAVHIFGGNEIPATYEKGSGAHKRRWTFLHIEGFQATGNYSKNFANEVFDACPQGVLNFALDGLLEVLETNGHYFTPDSGSKKMDEWQRVHDPVALFLHEINEGDDFGIKMSKTERIERPRVWTTFVAWYRHAYNKLPKIGKIKFYEAFEKANFATEEFRLVKVEGVYFYRGLVGTDKLSPSFNG